MVNGFDLRIIIDLTQSVDMWIVLLHYLTYLKLSWWLDKVLARLGTIVSGRLLFDWNGLLNVSSLLMNVNLTLSHYLMNLDLRRFSILF